MRYLISFRRLFAVILAAVSCATLAQAQVNDVPRDYDIPAGELAQAVNRFSQQSNLQVIYDLELLKNKNAPALKGRYAPREVLTQLLNGTGLQWSYANDNTIVLRKIIAAASQDNRITLARAEGPVTSVAQAEPEVSAAIPEVLVKGSRALNTDIKRSVDAVQPYVVFERKTIERSGATNLEDFLRQRLTASTGYIPNNQSADNRGNASSIDLRGLGPDETLILIDGRRAVGFVFQGIAQQPDINGIPLAAVERIEVLPNTASGIYGGAATGGVINIVLRRDYAGVEATLNYGNTFESDVASRRADLSAGLSLFDGRTNVLLSGSYADSNPLLYGERDFLQRAQQISIASNPSGPTSVLGGTNPPLGATTNIRSQNGTNLTLKPAFGNGVLGSPITSVPYGYAGPGSDNGAALIARAGSYNLNLAPTAQVRGAGSAIQNAATIKSLMGTIRHQFTERFEAFAEVSHSENAGTFPRGVSSSTFTLQATATSNPFNQAVNVTTPAFGTDQILTSDLKTLRATGGVIVKLPADWRAAADYTWGRNRFSAAPLANLNTTNATASVAAGTLNVFRDTNVYPVDFSGLLLPFPTFGPVKSEMRNAALRLSGPLPWSLPGGKPSLSMLAERREEEFDDLYSITPTSATAASRLLFPQRSQDVDSVYLETLLPLVSKQNSARGIELLEVQLAARHDRYQTESASNVSLAADLSPLAPILRRENEVSSTDPTIGLRYKPIADVMLRASFGTGFLPPAVNQLVPNADIFPDLGAQGVVDSQRGGELLGVVTVTSGGNANLRPEESQSRSAGIVFTPRLLPGLRFSADWTRIEKTDAITILPNGGTSQSDIDTLIAFAPQRVTRAAPSGGFTVGRITALDVTLLNFSTATVEAWDFALDYQWATDFGHLTLATGATHLMHNQTRITPTAAIVEQAGVFGQSKWRANATLTWEREAWTAAWTTRFFDSYYVQADHAVVPTQGSAVIPSQAYHDLFIGRRFAAAGLEAQLQINNLFNRSPPVDVISSGYSRLADPRLANYALSLRKQF